MGDKVKITSGRALNPPPSLALAERFAFISPYPLDACGRRLAAGTNPTRIVRLLGVPQMDAGIVPADMNDQYFALTNADTRCWALGAISDVDGERTLVMGAAGFTPLEFWGRFAAIPATVMVLDWLVFPLAAAVLTGALLFFVQAQHFNTAKARMREHMRHVFGLEGDGPLPLSDEVDEVPNG
jgi:hypothetical protein